MRLILANKSSRDPAQRGHTSERLVNFYPVPAPEGAISPLMLRSVPGTRNHASVSPPMLRQMAVVQGRLYVASAGGLYRVGQGGTSTYLAAIPNDINTAIDGHRGEVTIAAGGEYFVWDDANGLSQPGSGRIGATDVGSVAFIDQYTVMSERNGREIEWTEIGDPTTRNSLHFATTEGRDDNNIRLMRSGNYLFIFKQRSYEIWATTQEASENRRFARVPGAVADTGLLDFNLVTRFPAGLFFVGHDRVAYVTDGLRPTPVSTPTVDNALQKGQPTHCFYYEDRGHRFCVIRFDDRPAWVFDAAMGVWHERAHGVDHEPWGMVSAELAHGRWYLGNRTGRVVTLGTGPWDATAPLRRTVVSRPAYGDGERFTVPFLELGGNWGESSITVDGPAWLITQDGLPLTDHHGDPIRQADVSASAPHQVAPQVSVRFSRDGGRTFGEPKLRGIGRQGEYDATVRFRALGQFRKLVAEVSITDPVEVDFLGEANIVTA